MRFYASEDFSSDCMCTICESSVGAAAREPPAEQLPPVRRRNAVHLVAFNFSICACHPCAGAML